MSLGVPAVVNTRCGSPPSLLATPISVPLQYATFFPSGDHAPACPSSVPNRRGEPPSTGTLQSGPSSDVPCAVFINSADPSGEISNTFANPVFSNDVGIANVSPPVTDVCERIDWLSMKYSRRPVRHDPRFRPVRVRQLHGSQHSWWYRRPRKCIAEHCRRCDRRHAHNHRPFLPLTTAMNSASLWQRTLHQELVAPERLESMSRLSRFRSLRSSPAVR